MYSSKDERASEHWEPLTEHVQARTRGMSGIERVVGVGRSLTLEESNG